MSAIYFAEPQWVHLIWLAAALVAVFGWLELRHREALGRFISSLMARRLARAPSRGARIARLILIATTLLFGILALMRPQTAGAPRSIAGTRVSGDVMIVLDTSRSMLAGDAAPSRLARAKAEIADLAGRLEEHRVGLVAFAGRAAVLAPPTTDDQFFRMVLREVDTSTVSRGGTNIGQALRVAVEELGPGDGAKLIVLITDGEDHDSLPLDAAKGALEAGIRVVTIGFGSETGSELFEVDPQTGARRPITDASGAPVVSRLDGALLRDIARITEGAYIPAGTAVLDLESIVKRHIEPLVREAGTERTRTIPGEQYPWAVLVALASLVAAVYAGSRSRGRRAL